MVMVLMIMMMVMVTVMVMVMMLMIMMMMMMVMMMMMMIAVVMIMMIMIMMMMIMMMTMMMMMMILMIAMIVVVMAMMKMAIKVFPASSVVLSHNYYSLRKPHQSIRYRGGRHLPPPRKVHPDHPLSPLGYTMSNGTSQTNNADHIGWLRPLPRRKPPIPYAKHGECHVTTCHSGDKWMASSATAEKTPTHPPKFKMANPWHISKSFRI